MHDNHHSHDEFTFSDAVTVVRNGSFQLDMPPDLALPLFTAPGEKLWIKGWNPIVLNGDGFEKGTVFVTNGHGHTTFWLVADYDVESHFARYVRTTPKSDTGTVEVSVAPDNDGGSIVSVTYRMTALSDAGNEMLRNTFSEASYTQMMRDWRSMIIENKDMIDGHSSG